METKFKSIEKFHLLCVFSVIIFFFVFSAVYGDNGERAEPEEKTAPSWLSRISQSGRSYWAKLVSKLGRGHSYFFPPKIDFSGKEEPTGGGGSTGEKVKEAAAKSFEKTKETVEEAARSTADAAAEAADKVKKTVSGGDEL